MTRAPAAAPVPEPPKVGPTPRGFPVVPLRSPGVVTPVRCSDRKCAYGTHMTLGPGERWADVQPGRACPRCGRVGTLEPTSIGMGWW